VVRHHGEPLQLQLQHFLGLIGGTIDAAAELETILPPHAVIDEIAGSAGIDRTPRTVVGSA